MFEAAELGTGVSKQAYNDAEPALQSELLALQRQLRDRDFPVIIVVAGVEGAGKGRVVSTLHKWFDARGLETTAFWDETDEERDRPRYWRFWRALPPRGRIGIMFGSWYTRPIIARVTKEIDRDGFERAFRRINEFEEALSQDGALIIKLWYHLTKQEQQKRLEEDAAGKRGRISPLTRKFARRYDRFVTVCERAIRLSDMGHAPWHVVEATDRRYRDLATGRIVAAALRERLEVDPVAAPQPARHGLVESKGTVLDRVDLSQRCKPDNYRDRLKQLQDAIYDLAWKAYRKRVNTVAVFEGWDAAGKGGAIRRLTTAVDARLYRVISIAAPTDEERAHHYLWRFWRHLPRAGYMTMFDRSWYGRVLVERVENFARPDQWGRAYQEINDFEDQLVEHGVVLLKFWLHIDPEEQARRFKERQETPWKQYKITDEDWRNRERWHDYELAVNEMVARTSTAAAPWTLVAANDKLHARIKVLETLHDRLDEAVRAR